MHTDADTPRRFAIALSFPGEHRKYVEQVAMALLPAFGGGDQAKARVFYDAWHESKVIGRPHAVVPGRYSPASREAVRNDEG